MSQALHSDLMFSDTAGNLFDKDFQLVTTSEQLFGRAQCLPLTSNAKTRAQYRRACLKWHDDVMSVVGMRPDETGKSKTKLVLPQPLSLFFRRPLDHAKGRVSPALMTFVEQTLAGDRPIQSNKDLNGGRIGTRITQATSWCGWEIASFPNLNMYDSFEQFEGACVRWLSHANSAQQALIEQFNLDIATSGVDKKRKIEMSQSSPALLVAQSAPGPSPLSGSISNLSSEVIEGLNESEPEDVDNQDEIRSRAAELMAKQRWYLHPRECPSVFSGLVAQEPKSVFSFPESAKPVADNDRWFIKSNVDFSGDASCMEQLKGLLKERGGRIVQRKEAIVDENVRDYENYGCSGDVRPSLPTIPKDWKAMSVVHVVQVVNLPFVNMAYERTTYAFVIRMIKQKRFDFARTLSCLYRTVNVVHAFIPCNVNIIDPLCDVLDKIEDADAFVQVYELFFRCYFWDLLFESLTQAQIEDCMIPAEIEAGKQRTRLVTYLNEKGVEVAAQIQGRLMDQNFAVLWARLLCVATLFEDEIISTFVALFSPFLTKFHQISQLSKHTFHEVLWTILSDRRILRAMLLDLSVSVRTARFVLTDEMIEYIRVLVFVDASILPDEMWKDTTWAIALFALLTQSMTMKSREALVVMSGVIDLMFRRWQITQQEQTPPWAFSVEQIQHLTLELLKDEAQNTKNARLLIEMLLQTILSKESLAIFRRESKSWAAFSAMFLSSDNEIRNTSWSILRAMFRCDPLMALDLMSAPPLKKILNELLGNQCVRAHAMYFIVDAVSRLEKDKSGKKLKCNKHSAARVFLEFIHATVYSFMWYDSKSRDREANDWGEIVAEIDKLMMNKFVNKSIKPLIDQEKRAAAQSGQKKAKEQRPSKK